MTSDVVEPPVNEVDLLMWCTACPSEAAESIFAMRERCERAEAERDQYMKEADSQLYQRQAAEARERKAVEALTQFEALARIKGGTPESEELKELLVVMMEHVGSGNGLRIIGQFASACLNARETLTAIRSLSDSGSDKADLKIHSDTATEI